MEQPTKEQIKDENKRIRYLRRMVDLTISLILQTDMSLEDARRHAGAAKEFAENLFPGKGHVFDLVYGPRIRRVIAAKYRLS